MIIENLLNNIVTILVINGSILVVPGVNFLLIVRYSLLNKFSTGVYCVLGITAAIMLHAILAIFSISFVLKSYPQLLIVIRYTGALYLFYLGTKFLVAFAQNKKASLELLNTKNNKEEAFFSGFLVDFFNPFISIFYISLFSMLIPNNKSLFELGCYLGTIFIITISWFYVVVRLFTYSLVNNYFQDKGRYVQVLSGIAMYYFCTKIIWEL